jgi:hypothetical protein
MKYILIIFSSLLPVLISGQDSVTVKLFSDAINFRRASSLVYYVDMSIVPNGNFSHFKKHGHVEGFIDPLNNRTTSMRFSKKELKYIDRQIILKNSIQWPDHLLPNSIRITSDSILNFLSNQTSSEYLKDHKDKWYYFFSEPIFIRNNTVAIFRLAEMINPSAGNDLMFVYLRIDETWTRKMTIWVGSW